MSTRTKDIDFKEVFLSMPDFIDNEAYESLLDELGIPREETDKGFITLTVTKVEVE